MKGSFVRRPLRWLGATAVVAVVVSVTLEVREVQAEQTAQVAPAEATVEMMSGYAPPIGYQVHRGLEAQTVSLLETKQRLPEQVEVGIRDHVRANWEALIVIDPSTSTGWVATQEEVILTFDVATGIGGLSTVPGSNGTPIGSHEIWATVAGDPQEILQGRQPTGVTAKAETGKGQVVTGLLALSGLESINQSSYARTIYIHGTNYPSSLGNGVGSSGCVRVSDHTIYELLDIVGRHATDVHILNREWTGI